MRNLINIMDLSVQEIDDLIKLADDIIKNPDKYNNICAHKILATLFFEPSTRTRLSFESAMLSLGGSVLGFSEAASSSATKGESVSDTVEVVSGYADIIAMRHPKEGAAAVGAMHTSVPIINAGDGGHYHPTQTLTDLLTIYHEKGHFDNLVVGICGDLKHGRTVHSLIGALSRYTGVSFVLISPRALKLPGFIKYEDIEAHGIEYTETEDLDSVIGNLDILYMTRVQKERFYNDEEYDKFSNSLILNEERMKHASENIIVLHPLPRVNEISVSVDKDPRACYFRQAKYGKYIRMALIIRLLESKEENQQLPPEMVKDVIKCHNPFCITSSEQELHHYFKLVDKDRQIFRCYYCEKKQK